MSFWKQFGDSSPLKDFDAEQANALIQLLIAATFVDYQVSSKERQSLIEALDAFPQFDEQQFASLAGDDGMKVITKIGLKYMDPDQREGFLDVLTAQFEQPEHARAAFDAVVAISHCDGLDSAEFEFCMDVGQRLGLSKRDIHQIVADAWAISDASM